MEKLEPVFLLLCIKIICTYLFHRLWSVEEIWLSFFAINCISVLVGLNTVTPSMPLLVQLSRCYYNVFYCVDNYSRACYGQVGAVLDRHIWLWSNIYCGLLWSHFWILIQGLRSVHFHFVPSRFRLVSTLLFRLISGSVDSGVVMIQCPFSFISSWFWYY